MMLNKSYLELAKKYGGWILSAVLLLIMFTCNNTPEHSEVIKYREKINVALKHKVDSLLLVNSAKDKTIAKSENAIYDLNKKVLLGRQDGAKLIAKVKNYELAEWKVFYQERSGFGDKDIATDSETLNFTKAPLIVIATNLINGDVAKAELKLKNGVIAEKDKIIDSEREKNVNLLSVNDTHKSIESNLENNVSDLKSDLKKANRIKIKPIIISAVLGGILGATISK